MLGFRTMPALVDLRVSVERLPAFTLAKRLNAVRVASPFVVHAFEPRVSIRTKGALAAFDFDHSWKRGSRSYTPTVGSSAETKRPATARPRPVATAQI